MVAAISDMLFGNPISADDANLELASIWVSLIQGVVNLTHAGVVTDPVVTVSNTELRSIARCTWFGKLTRESAESFLAIRRLLSRLLTASGV